MKATDGREFFVMMGGESVGPLRTEDVFAKMKAGEIGTATMITETGAVEWKKLGEVLLKRDPYFWQRSTFLAECLMVIGFFGTAGYALASTQADMHVGELVFWGVAWIVGAVRGIDRR